MTQDEPIVMSRIAELLAPLDATARSRVLGWTISALEVQLLRPAEMSLPAGHVAQQATAENDRHFDAFAIDTNALEESPWSEALTEWLFDEQDYTSQ